MSAQIADKALWLPPRPHIWIPSPLDALRKAKDLVSPLVVGYSRAAGDPYFSNVKLLLHMNGANASTSFTDDSQSSHVVTPNGNAQLSTAQFKYGGASGYFDGSGDFLTVDSGADFAFGTGDLTVEFWVRRNRSGTEEIFYDHRPSSTTGTHPMIEVDSSGHLNLLSNGVYAITGTTALASGVWYHIAWVRHSGISRLYLNGVQEGSDYSDGVNYTNPGSARPLIAASGYNSGSTRNLYGWLDDLRVTAGVARYISAFTPPTAQFPDS